MNMRLERTAKVFSAALVSAGLGLTCGAAPAQAGFFDQLFGMAPQPAPQAYEPPPTFPQADPAYAPIAPAHRARRHIADSKPVRQKTTDLMHDATLRAGDAVMMKDGLHVFEGDDGSRHVKADFVGLNEADSLSRKERAQLAAADTTHNDPLRRSLSPDTISSGRSAAVTTPIVAGVKITDARGHLVRYIGP